MDEATRQCAQQMRSQVLRAEVSPAGFREALMSVPPGERDVWFNRVLGLESLPDDGPDLPRGCVSYLPCGVDALLRLVDQAEVKASDVFVDVGSGVGRAAAFVHLLTGAATIGLEIQRDLVAASRDLATLHALRFSPIEGDAVELARYITTGSVFFLYCPFSGDRLERVVDDLEPIARTRPIRICAVDLPLPPRPWLSLASPPSWDLTVYRSNFVCSKRPEENGLFCESG